LIDLHTHTTASDGRCSPTELVARAARAGVTVLSVTDHDTVAAASEAETACRDAGLEFVTGIEITAHRGRADVHVLGYFIDARSWTLRRFLADQRRRRIERVGQMIERLASLGMVLNRDEILQPAIADPNRAAGRPWIARALVASGYVATTDEAFEQWLATGRPAFIPRSGPSPEVVFERIHEAGGVASLAHPGLLSHDDWVVDFSSRGLDALEAYHSEHTADDRVRYVALARRLGLAVSGGSDFHADPHGAPEPGAVALPRDEFDQLRRRATMRATASGADTSS
jgi:predicted metal-dependent phosphoesterase TrpH